MASSDDDERDDFVVLGTPVPDTDNDQQQKKPLTVQDLTAKDKQGRRRFHGAFTGGFSAGYFNTVGTKEGFTPSAFVSSKSRKSGNDVSEPATHAQPEDFMDEEDLEEHGIAPRKFATSSSFVSEERKRKRIADSKQVVGSSVLDIGASFNDWVVPEQLTVGIKLLRKMGWKEGQGLGPRVQQKKKKQKKYRPKSDVKVYGCAPPPSDDEQDSNDNFVPEDMSSVTFAPKDVTPISLEPKENVHGLGYRGLDPTLALPSSHINLFSAPPVRSKAGRKGISGQAFGVGAFEDEDEDIYTVDSLSNYDITMQTEEESDNKFGWTAPRDHGKQSVPVTYLGKLLEGFCISKSQLKPKKKFAAPTLPRGFRPHHWFRKQREISHIPEHLRESSGDGSAPGNKLTAVDRGILLGETPVMSSVFDLIPKADRERIDATKEAISMSKSLMPSSEEPAEAPVSLSSQQISTGGSKSVETDSTPGASMASDFLSRFKPASQPVLTESEQQRSEAQHSGEGHGTKAPLFHGGLSFQPFRKDPAKQKRYDQYLTLLKQEASEPFNAVASPGMTEWERARERDEFSKAAKMFRPMSAMMSSRFVSGAMIDDDAAETSLDSGSDQTDEVKAAEMKMFGKLTREEFEWHPHQLLCKRFNVPNPFPGSDIVGLPGVKRDKYSVFNFLSMGDFQSGATQEPSATREPPDKDLEHAEKSMVPARSKKATMASVFKVLDDPNFHKPTQPARTEEPETSQPLAGTREPEEKSVVGEEEKTQEDEEPAPDLDLFRAIFKNSDSEDSSEEEKEGAEEKDGGSSSAEEPDSPQEKVEEEPAPEDPVKGRGELPIVKTEVGDIVEDNLHSFRPLFSRRKKDDTETNLTAKNHEAIDQPALEPLPEPRSGSEHGFVDSQAAKKSHQWKSRWGGKSVFSVLDDMEAQDNAKDKGSNQRTSVEGDNANDNGDAAYGPSLPPPSSAASTSDRLGFSNGSSEKPGDKIDHRGDGTFGPSLPAPSDKPFLESAERGRVKERHGSRKESRSSHRKEKKKKSKHRKEKKHRKHKKSSKSRSKSKKGRHSSSGSEADSESDSASSVSDSELLERLKEVSKTSKSFQKTKHT